MTAKNLQPTSEAEAARLKHLAGQLKDNPIWNEALDRIKADYLNRWENTAIVAQLERDNAYHMVKAIEGLRNQIQSFVQTGKLSNDVAQNNVKRK